MEKLSKIGDVYTYFVRQNAVTVWLRGLERLLEDLVRNSEASALTPYGSLVLGNSCVFSGDLASKVLFDMMLI